MSFHPIFRGSSVKGSRSTQEDRYLIWIGRHPSAGIIHVAAVFDGHDGSFAAELCRRQLIPFLFSHSSLSGSSPPFITILRDTVTKLENIVLTSTEKNSRYDGCTLNILLLHNRQVFVANVGDSRSLLIRSTGRVIELSKLHTLKNESEKTRVERTDAIIRRGRILGERKFLTITRAIGDREMKEPKGGSSSDYCIIATSDCIQKVVGNGDIGLVVATDGLWDRGFIGNDDIGEMIKEGFGQGKSVEKIVKSIVDEGVRFGKDNLTLILIKLEVDESKKGERKDSADKREGVSMDRRPIVNGVNCVYWETSRAGNGEEASGSGSKRVSTTGGSGSSGKRKK